MRVAVIANGNKCTFDPQAYEQIICADGALNWASQRGISVTAVLGDMDSVDEHLLTGVNQVIRVKAEKDETDAYLALEYGAQFADEIDFYGALGGRLDHLMANVGLLTHYARRGIRVNLIDTYVTAFAAKGEIMLCGQVGQEISLIPAGQRVMIEETEGLKYPVYHKELTAEVSYFISNVMIAPQAKVCTDGYVIVILPRAERIER